jgi:hypothetical protein
MSDSRGGPKESLCNYMRSNTERFGVSSQHRVQQWKERPKYVIVMVKKCTVFKVYSMA